MAQTPREVHPTDTCARCGLRRATRQLESRGVQIRLCDDCYWGREPDQGEDAGPPA
jgi:hypothetical protein